MSQTKPIRGKVAQVLNNKEIVLNLGTEHGVYKGMCFNIVETTQIIDPDSSKILGNVERQKLLVKTIDVQEKLSVAYALDNDIVSRDTKPFATSLLYEKKVLIRIGDVAIEDSRTSKAKQQ